MFSALRMVTVVEVLVSLVAIAAGLGVIGLGQALAALREVALNTRAMAFGPNRPIEPSYGSLDTIAAILVGTGAVVALAGIAETFLFLIA